MGEGLVKETSKKPLMKVVYLCDGGCCTIS